MKACICTVIKNEHQYLDEWIQYHINLGIDHIFIFEDYDSKTHKNIVDKYRPSVTLNRISTVFCTKEEEYRVINIKREGKKNPQYEYLKSGLEYIKRTSDFDWCFAIDIDEFISPENINTNLNDIIALYDNYDAVVL